MSSGGITRTDGQGASFVLVVAPFPGVLAPGDAEVMHEVAGDGERGLLEIGMRMRAERLAIAWAVIVDPVDAHGRALQHLEARVVGWRPELVDLEYANVIRAVVARPGRANRRHARIG